MEDRLCVAARPSLAIGGVFRVCHIAKRSRLRGEMGFTLLTDDPLWPIRSRELATSTGRPPR